MAETDAFYQASICLNFLWPAYTWVYPENSFRGGPDNIIFSHQCISQRAIRTSLKKQLGPIASRGGGGSVSIISKEAYSHL